MLPAARRTGTGVQLTTTTALSATIAVRPTALNGDEDRLVPRHFAMLAAWLVYCYVRIS